MRKWKKMFSRHWECWRIEWTATMEPRRYSMSRVMAMWTREGPQTEVKTKEAHLPSATLRNGAMGRKERRDGGGRRDGGRSGCWCRGNEAREEREEDGEESMLRFRCSLESSFSPGSSFAFGGMKISLNTNTKLIVGSNRFWV
ncbi:hypothetical protein GLYMA_02G010250v4 [Glycine max]|nr:hypothetical protein GLYMA_02G010250v4 [Glycine max]KAH1058196.1 hypothetical protein GYH30_002654 [Glycine max]